jgi:hypothetical protein
MDGEASAMMGAARLAATFTLRLVAAMLMTAFPTSAALWFCWVLRNSV